MVAKLNIPAWPRFDPDEIESVEAVLKSGKVNYWTGNACRQFEAEWSLAHGGGLALSMANGSVTLDAALWTLGIGPGDEVIVSPRSYVASAMCVLLVGAKPVFAEVDAESGCITPATAEAVRSPNTRAVIPVHVGGWPCDMPGFERWSREHGIHIIEDCAQGHGGHINGRALGTFGSFGSWSFCQDKILSTGGEGGMLLMSDESLFKRCWAYCQHGKDHDESIQDRPRDVPGEFRWVVKHEGTNLRMTEMQAAIGLRQLRKLPAWSAERARNSRTLREALADLPFLRVPLPPEGHAHYRFTAFVRDPRGERLRNELLRALDANGLPAMSGSCGEIYREDVFARCGLTPAALGRGVLDLDGRLPVARKLGETSLSFPVHHTIDPATMSHYAALVRRVVEEVASRSDAAGTPRHAAII